MKPITRPRASSAWAAILLILAALYRFPSPHLRLSFQMLMEAAIALFFAHVLWRQGLRWPALFLISGLAGMMFPFYTRHSFLAFHAVLFGLLWLALLVWLPADTHIMLDAMCVIAGGHAFYLLLQAAGWDPLFAPVTAGRRPMTGLMANRNEVAALLAFCLPAFWRPRRRWWSLPVLAGLCLTKTSGAIVSAGAGWIVFQTLQGKWKIALATVTGAILLYVVFVDGFGTERLRVWLRGWEMYRRHWLLGAGLGHWKLVAPVIDGARWTTAHNEYLPGLFEMGLPFAVIAGGYAGHVLRFCRRAVLPAAGLAAVAVNAGVNFPFHIATTALIAVTWMALFEIERMQHE